MPVFPATSREADSDVTEVSHDYTFDITLTDSNSTTQNQTAKENKPVRFEDIPLGPATLKVVVYDSEISVYSGEKTFEVLEGNNLVEITLSKIKTETPAEETTEEDSTEFTITLILSDEAEPLSFLSEPSEITDEEIEAFLTLYKDFIAKTTNEIDFWSDDNNNFYTFSTKEEVSKFFESLSTSITLKAHYKDNPAANNDSDKNQGNTPEGGEPDPSGKPDPSRDPEYFTITLENGDDSKSYKTTDSLTCESFQIFGSTPDTTPFAYWYDSTTGKKWKFTSETDVTNFINSVAKNTTLTAKFGVTVSNLITYLPTLTDGDNKEIIVLDDETTSIPKLNTITVNVSGITLDFSECTSLTTMNSTAFVFSSENDRWISVLKLPPTITTISGIYGVKDAVYIPLPANTVSFLNNVSYKATSASNANSSYSVYFEGTLADWCSRTSLSSNSDFHPFTNIKDFYVLDSSRTEYIKVTGSALNIENKYMDEYGKLQTLTQINAHSFRFLDCTSITIPDSVITIGESAFTQCKATEVNIGSGVKSIATGAFYYNGDTPRTVKYYGSLASWLGISTRGYSKTDANEGGPLRGATYLYVLKEGNTEPSNVLDSDNALTISLPIYDKNNKEIPLTGQLQGLKSVEKIVIEGTPGSSYNEIKSYAFYNCSNLKTISITPVMKLSNNAFNGTKLGDVYLNSSDEVYAYSSNPFNNVDSYQTDKKIHVYVPNSLIDDYKEAWSYNSETSVFEFFELN